MWYGDSITLRTQYNSMSKRFFMRKIFSYFLSSKQNLLDSLKFSFLYEKIVIFSPDFCERPDFDDKTSMSLSFLSNCKILIQTSFHILIGMWESCNLYVAFPIIIFSHFPYCFWLQAFRWYYSYFFFFGHKSKTSMFFEHPVD